jgi:hypothetical protein
MTIGRAVLALAPAMAACGDSAPALAPVAARISIADDISVQRGALDWFASVSGPAVAISPDTVHSLVVVVTEVQFLPVTADEADAGGWLALTLDQPVSLDLMALPSESEGGIEIASGQVPVGSYAKVRLLVSGGEIVFDGPITLGAAPDFVGGTPYPVTIPSGSQTGLKTDVAFEVTAGADQTANVAHVVFEPGTTFLNVAATGSGRVNLNPVLRAP